MNEKLLDQEITWDKFDIPLNIIDTLIKNDFKTPSITQTALFESLKNDKMKSGILEAPTGTGKTIAFLSHALRVVKPNVKKPQVVIFVHTQILGFQILNECQKLQKSLGIESSLLLGLNANLEFNSKAQIVVSTPGAFVQNFIPVVKRGKTVPAIFDHDFQLIILDEADFYWKDSNMRENMCRVFGDLNRCQILLFSATLDTDISNKIVAEWLKNCREPFKVKKEVSLENTTHFYIDCRQTQEQGKLDLLAKIFDLDIYESGFKSIIFCKTRNQVDATYRKIVEQGYEASRYHGDMSQEERQVQYAKFLAGETRVLITTDVLARGIDIVTIALVINFEVPTDGPDSNKVVAKDTYVHRIGRGGRFGRQSVAITFVSTSQDMQDMKEIQTYVDDRFKKQNIITEMKTSEIEQTISEVFANKTADVEDNEELTKVMAGAKGSDIDFKRRQHTKPMKDVVKTEDNKVADDAKAEIAKQEGEILFD